MYLNYPIFIAQSVIPGGANPNSSIDNVVGIFTQKPNIDPTSIPGALDELWKVSMDGALYQITCGLSFLVAAIAMGFWCLKFYQTLKYGETRMVINDLMWPFFLVVLLSSRGKMMSDATTGMRDIMNGVNRSVNVIVDSEINLTAARQVLGFADVSNSIVDALFSACKSQTELSKLQECLRAKEQAANVQIRLMENKLLDFNYTPAAEGKSARWQAQIAKWKQHVQDYSKNRFDINNVIPNLENGNTDITQIKGFDDTEQFRRIILSFRGTFLYIIEVMMLVMGLMGPIPLALSLFPIGNKAILTWLTTFLSLGFCKICFTLISGLSSLAMVYSEPDNVDMLVASMILGLLAPVLSFSVASGVGFSALTNISYSGQGFKMDSGIGLYNPGSGQGGNYKNNPYDGGDKY
jgi:hypothetical protein